MKYLQGLIVIAIFIIISSGCKVAAPVQMPVVKEIPDTFGLRKDSFSMATVPWRDFFTDPQLKMLIDTAIKNNPDLLIAIQRIEVARAQVALSRGAMLPSLDGIASAGFDKYGKYTMNGVGNDDTNLSPNITKEQHIPSPTPDYFLGLRSSWEIDVWGKLRERNKAAIARLLASEKGRQYVVTELVAEVASMYYSLLALDNELVIIKRNIELQEKAVEIVQAQKAGGRATELAVQQFAAQLLNTRAIEFRTRQYLTATENQLNAIIGRYPQKIERDSSIMKQGLPTNLQVGLPADLLLNRPDIQEAEFSLRAAEADVKAARAAFLPSLTLSPYVGFNSFNASMFFNPASIAFGLIGGLTAPIFNNNQIKAGYAIANATNKEAVYQYQKAILNGFSETMTNLSNIYNNEQSFSLKEKEVSELAKAVSTANELYLTGYASYLEVITAQKGVLEAELQLTNQKKDIFQAMISLYRTLGGGWN
ncbi:TolC family protein [Danxiaibacter flavus]|uniref:TolC family protein n=1 Tax=Danxiaibacter flavus TaxID=3049108 RepID=A0ABV3ZNL2_9BACT|nr:TolC family protein [Chitinophagaceae bacterium DXS]